MPYHAQSLPTSGPRRPLTHGDKACVLARLNAARSAKRITRNHVDIGRAMLARIGPDGRLDPAKVTLAADVDLSERTVARALDAFREIRIIRWDQRRARKPGSWRLEQTSNAYEILVPEDWQPPEVVTRRSGGQIGRGEEAKILIIESDEAWRAAAMAAAVAQARSVLAMAEALAPEEKRTVTNFSLARIGSDGLR